MRNPVVKQLLNLKISVNYPPVLILKRIRSEKVVFNQKKLHPKKMQSNLNSPKSMFQRAGMNFPQTPTPTNLNPLRLLTK